jgi:glycosyltransferase involved in cell wall biosynthesis
MNIFLGNDKPKINYYREHHTEFRDDVLLPILNDPSITYIANSEHTRGLFMEFIHKYAGITQYDRCSVIYNILYGAEFDTTPIPKIPKRLIYASAWQKGIWKVIDIFRYIVSRDADYSLTLLSPGYDWWHFKDYASSLKEEFGDRIIILGPSAKRELCIAIKESVCCLSSTFNETFGCVFAESIYLGTPVIADKRSGAVREIIGDANIVDYDNPITVYDKLQTLPVAVTLSSQFLPDLTISKWISLVCPDTQN